jgi:hypothetical protein
MDKHIFHCDEVANDDDSYDASYDDNHLETAKRVAENAFKTPSCDQKAKTATPYGQKTDEYESTRPPAGNNNTIIGNTKGKARSKVRKMDNHIVDSDVVESDDDLSDDIHLGLLPRPCSALASTSSVVPASATTNRHVSPTALRWTKSSVR